VCYNLAMRKTRLTAAIILLALAFSFGTGLYAGVSERGNSLVGAATVTITNITSGTQAPVGVDAEEFWRAWGLLDQNFVKSSASSTVPSAQERLWGAIKGLTESYEDPYTVFLPPQEAKEFQEAVSGSFSGIGMELGSKEGVLTVVAPLKGTPAERAGVQSGDIIAAIDGIPSRAMKVDEAVRLIRGERGTAVDLTLERDGKMIEFSIIRDIIVVPILNSYRKGDVFVIELYSFTETSPALFQQALREFFASGSTKMVLDMRDNPGGYLEAAVDMASYFLPVGEPVVTEDFAGLSAQAGKQPNVVHRSVGYNVFANKKLSMAILVDEGSASASEILAGALQQHGKAVLIGERTFGKGSVQQLFDLGGGAQLKITMAKWLTPNGSSISDGGLKPDIDVKRTPEDTAAGRDPQFDHALTWLASQ